MTFKSVTQNVFPATPRVNLSSKGSSPQNINPSPQTIPKGRLRRISQKVVPAEYPEYPKRSSPQNMHRWHSVGSPTLPGGGSAPSRFCLAALLLNVMTPTMNGRGCKHQSSKLSGSARASFRKLLCSPGGPKNS